MSGYPQFSFWISIAADMIYLSHIVIIWEKILPISGHRPLRCGLAKTRLRHPPLLLIVSPAPSVQSVDAYVRTYVRTLGQSRDNQTKRG